MLNSPQTPVNNLQAVAQLLNEVRGFLDDAIAKQEDRIQEELAAQNGNDGVADAQFHAQLRPHLAWVQDEIEVRLNGLLPNWYDASFAHHIGPHHDETAGPVGRQSPPFSSLTEEFRWRTGPTRYSLGATTTAMAQ